MTELGEEVDPFVMHIFAAMCERERLAISERTRGVNLTRYVQAELFSV